MANRFRTAELDSRHPQSQEVPGDEELRVEILWDADFSDVDLHVVEPGGEEVWYRNLKSRNGGWLHRDITTGFGPEVYTIPATMPGEYRVALVYFRGDRTEANATTLVHVMTLQRGRRSDYLVILENDRDRVEVASVK
jgi:uncharacterized protein YfaP (DUF2135 family)